MKIELTWPEVRCAIENGIHRHVYDSSKNFKLTYGTQGDFFQRIELTTRGCVGEVAVSKALNLYWTGVGGLRFPDVGGLIEVRTISQKNHRLILHDADVDSQIAILVFVGEEPTQCELMGWIPCSEGKSKEFESDPVGGRPAYFIPQKNLRPMEDIWAHIKQSAPRKLEEAYV